MFGLFEKRQLRLRSATPGRHRWSVPALADNARVAAELESALAERPGVVSVKASVITGGLLVQFDPRSGVGERLRFEIESVLGGAVPATLARAPRFQPATDVSSNGSNGNGTETARPALTPFVSGRPVTELLQRVGIPKARIRRAQAASILNVFVDLLPSVGLIEIINAARNQGSRLLFAIGVRSIPAHFAILGVVNVGVFAFALYFTRRRKQAWRDLAAEAEERIRLRTYDHIQRMDMQTLDSHNQGRLARLVLDDPSKIKSHLERSKPELLRRAVFGASLLGILSFLTPSLGLIAFAPLPFIVLSAVMLRGPMRMRYAEVQKHAGRLSHLISNNLASLITIKSFGAEDYEKSRIDEVGGAIAVSEKESFETTMWFGEVGQMMFFTGWVGTLSYGGHLMSRGALTQNAFSTLIYMIPQLVESFYGIDDLFDTRQKAHDAARRNLEFMDTPIVFVDGTRRFPKIGTSGHIRFQDVRFDYGDGKKVLDGLNLTVPAGKITGIVGATGSGKSTILKLLMRLYDVKAGRILIGQTDVRDVLVQDLRAEVGYVSQDVYLFNAPLLENITYGHRSASTTEVREAVALAGASDFVEELPQGYDTVVGDYGTKLSGGQRQRISIARAMLRDPSILLLDEATSAVDTDTEAIIQRAIERASMGRTTLIVAHRLSTIRNAASINVIKDGRVAESGTHDELLARNGLYARMWRVQTGELALTAGSAGERQAEERHS